MDHGPVLPARSEIRGSLRPAKFAASSCVTRSALYARLRKRADGNTAFMLLDRGPKRAAMIVMVLAAIVMFRFAVAAQAATWPEPTEGTWRIASYRFADGEQMSNVHLHYVTLGLAQRNQAGNVKNAVLLLHGTAGSAKQFLSDNFGGVLFTRGGLLTRPNTTSSFPTPSVTAKSSKPSNGLHARFPHYDYRDMVALQHAVVADALHVDQLVLVLGTSMGGMHTWLWGETYPTIMDALMPLACLPVQIGGRNRVWRDMVVDELRNDPGYDGGEYTQEPYGLTAAIDLFWILGGSAPVFNQESFPTGEQADAYFATRSGRASRTTTRTI